MLLPGLLRQSTARGISRFDRVHGRPSRPLDDPRRAGPISLDPRRLGLLRPLLKRDQAERAVAVKPRGRPCFGAPGDLSTSAWVLGFRASWMWSGRDQRGISSPGRTPSRIWHVASGKDFILPNVPRRMLGAIDVIDSPRSHGPVYLIRPVAPCPASPVRRLQMKNPGGSTERHWTIASIQGMAKMT